MSIKIVTINVNGIRSAYRKGFCKWLHWLRPDVVCIQETKARVSQLTDDILKPAGYYAYFNDAEKKGYSGVAIFSCKRPQRVKTSLGWYHADTEGRYLQADFGNLSIISIYLPSGSSGEERQKIKFDFMNRLMPMLKQIRKKKTATVLCGDWNIAHKQIDLKNWRGNQKNSGFLLEERNWMTSVFEEVGLVDAFRVLNQEPEQYTWWSNRGQAWDKNVGWRIDYQVVSPCLKNKIKNVEIYKKERFSDHAPLIIDYIGKF